MPGAQWAKLIANCACNALSAIAQLPFGPLLRGEGIDDVMRDVMRDVVEECLAMAHAARVRMEGDLWQVLVNLLQSRRAIESAGAAAL